MSFLFEFKFPKQNIDFISYVNEHFNFNPYGLNNVKGNE